MCELDQHFKSFYQATYRRFVLYTQVDDKPLEGMTPLLESIERRLLISDQLEDAIAPSKLKHHLGRETDLLIVDCRAGIDPNVVALGAGLVVGGGGIVLLLSTSFPTSPFEHWFAAQLTSSDDCYRWPMAQSDGPERAPRERYTPFREHGFGSADQQRVVEAIVRAGDGHSKRPLVLTADRGRGKSAALGIALAQLAINGQTRSQARQIVVTAPSFANAETLFRHAADKLNLALERTLQFANTQIRFVAPDELLLSDISADLVVVDEAAAIPQPLLLRLAERFRRMVFATTVHGYEGSGRGFSLKFVPALAARYPQYRQISMHTPIRWAPDCGVERWLNQVFLLNADRSDNESINAVVPPRCGKLDNEQASLDEVALAAATSAVSYRRISAEQLQQPKCLRQVFGLLVAAHYQTSPADLKQLLDDNAIDTIGAFDGEILVGVCVTLKEGGFDDALAELVVAGKRRPKGHLVAQSLASHAGIKAALTSQSTRVMRIAVLPAWRRCGVGRGLLEWVKQNHRTQYLSTSFGMSAELLAYWQSVGFLPVRIGIQRDAASGYHSLMMIAKHAQMPKWVAPLHQQLCLDLPRLLVEQLQQLDAEVVLALLATHGRDSTSLSALDNAAVARFVQGQTSFDMVVGALTRFLTANAGALCDQPDVAATQLVEKCLLAHRWETLLARHHCVSRKVIEQQWRVWLANQFTL
uniref:GNAT family N-acetyltransferase n=1 Tax=Thaumasiovibrio occultus TaxID=1891184 RepID=UPI000B34AD91|nr:GNAT family N-acetyltransferase [Thaumasiovibrio occultus]